MDLLTILRRLQIERALIVESIVPFDSLQQILQSCPRAITPLVDQA